MTTTTVLRTAAALTVALCAAFPPAAAATDDAEQRIRPLRSGIDLRETPNGIEPVRIDVLFDYDTGTALQKVSALDGTVLEAGPSDRIPAPGDDEIELARRIVLSDPDFHRTILELDIHLEGGFVLSEAEGERCGPATRCLQLFGFVHGDGRRPRFCSVVDLVNEEIAYRDYWGLWRDEVSP